MFKVSVMYSYTEGARFDHIYYRDRHMPMVMARLGSACAYYTVEKGLAGRAPGSPPAFVAMCAFIGCGFSRSPKALRRYLGVGSTLTAARRCIGGPLFRKQFPLRNRTAPAPWPRSRHAGKLKI